MTDNPPIFGMPAFGNAFGDAFGQKIGFSPKDIPNLGLWLKSTDGIVLNGSDISAWNDQSGNNRNAIQATASRQPLFVASGINGLPMVEFNGVDSTGEVMAVDLTFLIGSNMTIYSVMRRSSSKANNYFLGSGPAAQDTGLHVGWKNNGDFNIGFFNNDLVITVPDFTTNVPIMSITSFSSSSGKESEVIREGSTNTGSDIDLDPLGTITSGTVGQGFTNALTYFAGDISEILVYSRMVTTDENDAVKAYLAARYNITLP